MHEIVFIFQRQILSTIKGQDDIKTTRGVFITFFFQANNEGKHKKDLFMFKIVFEMKADQIAVVVSNQCFKSNCFFSGFTIFRCRIFFQFVLCFRHESNNNKQCCQSYWNKNGRCI